MMLFTLIAVGLLSIANMIYCRYKTFNKSAEQWRVEDPIAADFLNYLQSNPQQRFWQALSNWSNHHVLVYPINKSPIDLLGVPDLTDTWNWKGRHGSSLEDELNNK